MTFPRILAAVAPLVALAVTAPAANAGPMSWTYKAVVQAGDGSSVAPAAAVLELSRFDTVKMGGGAFTHLPTGDAGTMDGSGTIVLAAASKGDNWIGDPPGPEVVNRFRTLLEITDTESGARGFTYMSGHGALQDGTAGSGEVQLQGEGRVLMSLGKHRYDITWHQAESESVSRLVADVTVTGIGVGVNTPEPATLALAGLGLGAVGVRRLRRR